MRNIVRCNLQLVEVRFLQVQGAMRVTEQIENAVKVVSREFQSLPGPFASSIDGFPAANDDDLSLASLSDFSAHALVSV